jgi:prepilin-type N-terminal cleavage/methylation domain-containing protein/prepilin-type processing-associated H-X9-DG protein
MKTKSSRGFTMLEVIIVLAILAVLGAMLIPQMARRRACGSGINCLNNLKQISLSARQWAMDNGDKHPSFVSITNGGTMEWSATGDAWRVFMVMSNELNTPHVLFCPKDKRKSQIIATTFSRVQIPGQRGVPFTNNNNVSYLVGLDADETQPQRILFADSNLELNKRTVPQGHLNLWTNAPVSWDKARHEKQTGNVALADGSVAACTEKTFRVLLAGTLLQTNRLLIP